MRQGGTERNRTRQTRAATATRGGRRAGPTGTSFLQIFDLSTLLFILLFFFLVTYLLFFFLVTYLFFRGVLTTIDGAGPDVTNAGAPATRDGTGRGTGRGGNWCAFCCFCCSISTLLFLLPLFSGDLQYNNRQGMTGQGVPGAMRVARATRDGTRGRRTGRGGRRVGWRPKEERASGGGNGDEQGTETGGRPEEWIWVLRRAGDDNEGRGGRVSRSGRRLSNIAAVLPLPWLRDMFFLSTISKLLSNKIISQQFVTNVLYRLYTLRYNT